MLQSEEKHSKPSKYFAKKEYITPIAIGTFENLQISFTITP